MSSNSHSRQNQTNSNWNNNSYAQHVNYNPRIANRSSKPEGLNHSSYDNNANNTKSSTTSYKSVISENKRGMLIYQSEHYTKEQLQCVHHQYGRDVEKLGKMVFADNDIDKSRVNGRNRQYHDGHAGIMGQYDRLFTFGITTKFYLSSRGYPHRRDFQFSINTQFQQLQNHLLNGFDVVIPKPTQNDIAENKHRYYKDGQQVIFHNIGTDNPTLPFNYLVYIQQKIDDLRNYARDTKTIRYYNYQNVNEESDNVVDDQKTQNTINELLRQIENLKNQLKAKDDELKKKEQELKDKDVELKRKEQELKKQEQELKDKEQNVEQVKEQMTTIVWEYEGPIYGWRAFDSYDSARIEGLEVNQSLQIRRFIAGPFGGGNEHSFRIKKLSATSGEQIDLGNNEKINIRRTVKVLDRDTIASQEAKIAKLQKNEVLYEKEKQKVMKIATENDKLRNKVNQYKDKEEKLQEIYEENQRLKNKKAFLCLVWQWKDTDGTWKSYDDNIAKEIDRLTNGQIYEYTSDYNGVMYEIEKLTSTTGLQTNVKTGTTKLVKRNETEGYSDHIEYPEWWSKSSINATSIADRKYAEPSLNRIRLDTKPGIDVVAHFRKTCPNRKIIKIESVENQMLYDSYCNAKKKLIKLIGEENLNIKRVWHGTGHGGLHVMGLVQKEGFRKEFNSTFVYGQGTYFARDASYSCPSYCCCDDNGIYQVFQCEVIMGESYRGSSSYNLKTWPKKDGGKGLIYDSLVNNINDPSIFVIHENVRAYPMFVIHFR